MSSQKVFNTRFRGIRDLGSDLAFYKKNMGTGDIDFGEKFSGRNNL